MDCCHRNNPPADVTRRAIEVLRDFVGGGGAEVMEFNVKSLEYAELKSEKERIEEILSSCHCLKCPLFMEHVGHSFIYKIFNLFISLTGQDKRLY